MIVTHLGPDSATARALDDSGAAAWPLTAHLTAIVADRLAQLIYVTTLAHTDPNRRSSVPRPDPIPRPGVPDAPGAIRFGGRHGSRHLKAAGLI